MGHYLSRGKGHLPYFPFRLASRVFTRGFVKSDEIKHHAENLRAHVISLRVL